MGREKVLKGSVLLFAMAAAGSFAGCASYEANTGRGNVTGYFIRTEMQDSDRALDSARAAGKDRQCPDEYKKAEAARDHAYDVYRACHTEEGVALAKEAQAQANALCPAQPVKAVPPPRDSLTIAPGSITKGQTATLTWNSENASNCSIKPDIGAVAQQGSMTVTPADNVTYTLTCSGEGGTALSAASVTVLAPAPEAPADKLFASPASVAKGEPVTLTWSSKNASNCQIDPGVGPVEPQGSMTVTPAASTTYTLTCSGEGGSAKSAANVNVAAPAAPTDTLTVSPESITKGDSATLSWSSTNATDCNIQPGIGKVPPQGSMAVLPAGGTTYTLTCNGPGGSATSSANVAVAAAAAKAAATKLCKPTVINIHFDTNKYDIKPEYHNELKQLADFLTEFPKATGTIEGYTDSVGNKAANMTLSQRRADSVRKYLIDKFGISPERVKAVGYGPNKPIADNKTRAGKEQNRRIESNFQCEEK
ncbi:OmpA family protein [Geomesophilobacter sediminis]|nr:OmpA family protein [Geomesophilobacter sediminis]